MSITNAKQLQEWNDKFETDGAAGNVKKVRPGRRQMPQIARSPEKSFGRHFRETGITNTVFIDCYKLISRDHT